MTTRVLFLLITDRQTNTSTHTQTDRHTHTHTEVHAHLSAFFLPFFLFSFCFLLLLSFGLKTAIPQQPSDPSKNLGHAIFFMSRRFNRNVQSFSYSPIPQSFSIFRFRVVSPRSKKRGWGFKGLTLFNCRLAVS